MWSHFANGGLRAEKIRGRQRQQREVSSGRVNRSIGRARTHCKRTAVRRLNAPAKVPDSQSTRPRAAMRNQQQKRWEFFFRCMAPQGTGGWHLAAAEWRVRNVNRAGRLDRVSVALAGAGYVPLPGDSHPPLAISRPPVARRQSSGPPPLNGG
jgi:hypothetical protein